MSQAGENLSQILGGITELSLRGQASSPHTFPALFAPPPVTPLPKTGDLLLWGAPALPQGGITGFKGLEKKHSDAKHAKNYFTDKQQRMGLVPGAELVLYYTNILLKGKEWLKYTHLLTQIKSQCAFSIASPTPSSLHLQLLPRASAQAVTPPATESTKPWVKSACASVFN